MSAKEKAAAPQLEPALLRSGNIDEDVIWACRAQDVLDREVFVALLHTVEGFTQAVSAGLGIDPAVGFSHSREMAKMVKAWNGAKVQAEVKNERRRRSQSARRANLDVEVWLGLVGDEIRRSARRQHPRDKASGTVVLRKLRRSSC